MQATQPASPVSGDAPALGEALRWLSEPARVDVEYDFELTVEIRLLLIWTAKDGVGGGYIKLGRVADDPSLDVIQLLFGSDPAKARGINRWGAGMEVAKRGPDGAVDSSAFLGFMKSSQGGSAGAMQQELSNEKQKGLHRFEAVISRVDRGSAISTTVPFYSDRDYDFHELQPAEQTVLEQIQDNHARKFHALDANSVSCSRGNGFLSTVQKLVNDAVETEQAPIALCYLYNSKDYTLTLDGTRPVLQKTVAFSLTRTRQRVEHSYRDLEEARFHVLNRITGKKTFFSILLGTTGALRGVPVQINYQPNWWFRIMLNLMPPADSTTGAR